MSGDGTKFVAAGNEEGNSDRGTGVWVGTMVAPAIVWIHAADTSTAKFAAAGSLAVSADGKYIAAGSWDGGSTTAYDGYLYLSTDYGETFTKTLDPTHWHTLTFTRPDLAVPVLLAGSRAGFLLKSTNMGSDWTDLEITDDEGNSAAMASIHHVAVSDDGTTMAAIMYGNYIWISRDSGDANTWRKPENAADAKRNWECVAMDGAGSKMIAVETQSIWQSTDGGQTFPTGDSWDGAVDGDDKWKGCAMSRGVAGQFWAAGQGFYPGSIYKKTIC